MFQGIIQNLIPVNTLDFCGEKTQEKKVLIFVCRRARSACCFTRPSPEVTMQIYNLAYLTVNFSMGGIFLFQWKAKEKHEQSLKHVSHWTVSSVLKNITVLRGLARRQDEWRPSPELRHMASSLKNDERWLLPCQDFSFR